MTFFAILFFHYKIILLIVEQLYVTISTFQSLIDVKHEDQKYIEEEFYQKLDGLINSVSHVIDLHMPLNLYHYFVFQIIHSISILF